MALHLTRIDQLWSSGIVATALNY